MLNSLAVTYSSSLALGVITRLLPEMRIPPNLLVLPISWSGDVCAPPDNYSALSPMSYESKMSKRKNDPGKL